MTDDWRQGIPGVKYLGSFKVSLILDENQLTFYRSPRLEYFWKRSLRLWRWRNGTLACNYTRHSIKHTYITPHAHIFTCLAIINKLVVSYECRHFLNCNYTMGRSPNSLTSQPVYCQLESMLAISMHLECGFQWAVHRLRLILGWLAAPWHILVWTLELNVENSRKFEFMTARQRRFRKSLI